MAWLCTLSTLVTDTVARMRLMLLTVIALGLTGDGDGDGDSGNTSVFSVNSWLSPNIKHRTSSKKGLAGLQA